MHNYYTGPIHQFSDHSIRLLLQEPANVQGLIDIVARHLSERLDFNRLVHVNRSFIWEDLREQEADLVYRLPFRSSVHGGEVLVYILIEHQSTVDSEMAFRLLSYMVSLWYMQRRDWHTQKVPVAQRRLYSILPIVLYTGTNQWNKPLTLSGMMDVPEGFEEFVPSFKALFLSVKTSDPSELTPTDNAFGWLLTVLQKEKVDKTDFVNALLEALPRIHRLDPEEAERWQQAILYLYQLIAHQRPKEERVELHTLLSEQIQGYSRTKEVETMAQTWAEHLFEQGIERGIEQGIERGIEQGEERGGMKAKRELILKLIYRQFMDVPDHVTRAINATDSHARLDALFDEILNAETLDDIEWNTPQE